MSTGIDFLSAGYISASAISAAGYDFVANYLGRGLTADLAQQYMNEGLSVVSLYEETASFYYNGYYHPDNPRYYNPNNDRSGYLDNVITYWNGYYQAQRAHDYAVDVGQPAGSAIYFAVDTDILSNGESRVADYFHGINAGLDDAGGVHYQVGIYGDHNALDTVYDQGLADYKWLAAGWRYDGTTAYHISQTDNDSHSDGFPAPGLTMI